MKSIHASTGRNGTTEWYTPQNIIELSREVMGSIDLDPFFTEYANRTVQASRYYTKDDNGLTKNWFGNIWMNHPFGIKTNPLCIDKLMNEYQMGNISQACCICYSSTSERWFWPLLEFPQCFIRGRTKYYNINGKSNSPPRGSVVTYLGNNISKFNDVFSEIGTVK